MRIGELAERAGMTTKALRFYERAGLLPAPERTPSGYRDYDGTALDRLRFVRAAQAAGLTLAEVAEVIAAREHTGPPCGHVAALLDARAADLDARIADLAALRAEVQRLRDRATTLDPAACGDDKVCHVIPSWSSPLAAQRPLGKAVRRPAAPFDSSAVCRRSTAEVEPAVAESPLAFAT